MKQHTLFHPQSEVTRVPGEFGEQFRLTLLTAPEHRNQQAIKQLFVRAEPDHEETLFAMKRQGKRNGWDVWQATIPVAPHSHQTLYCFKALFETGQIYLHAAGQSPRLPQKHQQFRISQFQPPEWVKQQVFYQIFPERFHNGDPSNDYIAQHYPFESNKPVVIKQWGEPVAASHDGTGASEFYGGDLPGITQKLDYLQELGITGIYLNPIFHSPSNHKYDTFDYLQVDPCFGGNQALVELSEAMKQREMRLMLDAVVNHTSSQHPWIDVPKKLEGGAFDNPDSAYRDFYNFFDDGNYWSWKGCDTLPKLNFANDEVRDYIYASENSVLKHWLRPPYSIDAWRFDVVHMLGETTSAQNNGYYVAQFRDAIKQTNPDAYMIGEHFAEATQWLQGEQEDGAMNYYGFAHPVIAFLLGKDVPAAHLVDLSADEFVEWLDQAAASIPFANQLAQYNLLDSHDTARFLYLADGDKQALKLATTLLLTYKGVPSIYYGDEVGLSGGYDPDCRRSFPWDESDWDHDLLSYNKQLIALRKARLELQQGDLFTLYTDQDCWAFMRYLNGQHSVVVVNRSAARELQLPLAMVSGDERYHELFSGQAVQAEDGVLSLHVAEKASLVLSSVS